MDKYKMYKIGYGAGVCAVQGKYVSHSCAFNEISGSAELFNTYFDGIVAGARHEAQRREQLKQLISMGTEYGEARARGATTIDLPAAAILLYAVEDDSERAEALSAFAQGAMIGYARKKGLKILDQK